MPSLVNRLVVEELRREFKDAQGMLVVSFGGLTVKESEALRGQMAAKGVKFSMVRNSLARIALKDRGLEFADGMLAGNTGIAYGPAEAAIHAAKLFTTAEVKKAGKVTIRVGMLEGKLLDAKDSNALASVPDRKTLNGKLVSCIAGPLRGVVGVLNAGPAGMARLLQARADLLESQAGAAPAEATPS
jgi:large subunit ribosomal protein L10